MATGSTPSNSYRTSWDWAQEKNSSRVIRGRRRAMVMRDSIACQTQSWVSSSQAALMLVGSVPPANPGLPQDWGS